MAITLKAEYSRKIGKPSFSSEGYSICLETEISDLSQVSEASQRIHALLRSTVDRELGIVLPINGNGDSQAKRLTDGNGANNSAESPSQESDWHCTDNQRDYILKLQKDRNIPDDDFEELAYELFNLSPKLLDRGKASDFIKELLARFDASNPQERQRRERRSYPRRALPAR